MVEESLVKKLKKLVESGADSAEADDVLKIFELYKQISEEVDYLKQDLNEEEMIGQVVFNDVDQKYWLKATNGKVEYGKGEIEGPLFSLAASKDVGMGLFLGELDANIITPLGKLKAGGNFKNLRAFQEYYEDAIEEFKKRY